ncbi:N-acylglucosamine 2-epimerase [Hydrogenophaga crassostreae]|uniref:N-acylglucosamine 2-epimerase n=1 Tax=Hydrogenophaga crassostreae TaxID=1763535 RepID=A0A162T892_9BURK|nr:AGE family epimerase/isomerase [Hydrogenophaga crassostreae]AOW13764.1 N-acylglucosamine 2-epimerase [Hydrogenophaga crassostreae]OAD44274.1 N-acylglucosamine 2-epimerase [Hydrogenophaga crassostreae]
MTPERPDFRSAAFLRQHANDCMVFYTSHAIDPSGGMFHFLKDNGEVYDSHTRHLVSSTRFVVTTAMSLRRSGDEADQARLIHALAFLRNAHHNPDTGGYAWLLDWREGQARVLDATNHAYGLAFVLLAHAHAAMAGLADALIGIGETYTLLEQRFWEPQHGLYADEATANWELSAYRGQNANMHLCEALLAAFDATGETRYLDRAELLADNICIRQAALADGLIWEHYRADWSIDWDYNRDDKTNIFRPWGFQPGHLTEWAKLLMLLNARRPRADHTARARHFFDIAMEKSWDTEHGGLFYGFAPDGSACDTDKYFWVQAETLAAAARLAIATQDPAYWTAYDRIWAYAWVHFVDHEHGAWWRILRADNSKISDEKSPAGKVDYHTAGACWDVLDALGEGLPPRSAAARVAAPQGG